MAILTADELLKADDLPEKELDMSLWWPGNVRIKAITRAQLQTVRDEAGKNGPDQLAYDSLLIAESMVEPKLTAAQARKLRRKNAQAIEFILQELWSLNGITPTGEVSAKAVDDAEAAFCDGDD